MYFVAVVNEMRERLAPNHSPVSYEKFEKKSDALLFVEVLKKAKTDYKVTHSHLKAYYIGREMNTYRNVNDALFNYDLSIGECPRSKCDAMMLYHCDLGCVKDNRNFWCPNCVKRWC